MGLTGTLPPPSSAMPILAADAHECRCGHISLAHEHYRRGTDCALCACARFHGAPALMLRRWVRDERYGAA